MGIKLKYEKQEEIPEAHKELYTEKEGAWHLTGVDDMKTQEDVDKLQKALNSEREVSKEATKKAKTFEVLGDRPVEEIKADLDKIDEYKAAADGKLNEEKLEEMAESRAKQKIGPIEKEKQELIEKTAAQETEISNLKSSIEDRDRRDAVRAAAVEAKVLTSAIPDIELIAANLLERNETTGEFIVKADAAGFTAGVDVKTLLTEMQKSKPHFFPQSSGGGNPGGNNPNSEFSDNPWSAENWNITKQAQFIRQHGNDKANQAAKEAGSSIGASQPPEKK